MMRTALGMAMWGRWLVCVCVAVGLMGAMAVGGCDSEGPGAERDRMTVEDEEAAERWAGEEAGGEDGEDGVTTVRITGDDQMQYSINSFTVPAGSTVRIEFENVGDLPKAQMGHNVVVMKGGADVEAFVRDAATAVQNDYFPEERSDEVIAHTELIGPDQTDTIEFEAPPAGEYVYLCSFPGHYAAGMKGTMTVTEEEGADGG